MAPSRSLTAAASPCSGISRTLEPLGCSQRSTTQTALHSTSTSRTEGGPPCSRWAEWTDEDICLYSVRASARALTGDRARQLLLERRCERFGSALTQHIERALLGSGDARHFLVANRAIRAARYRCSPGCDPCER